VLPPRAQGEQQMILLERRRFSTYQTQVSFLIDVPGFGVGRTDIPMNKPAEMAPTFAYLATSDAVKREVVRSIGRFKEVVAAGAVENSPIFQVVVEGNDPERVAEVAKTYTSEIIKYITQQQNTNNIPNASRLKVRALGRPSTPKKTASRDVEIAALLFLGPILLAALLSLSLESLSRQRQVAKSDSDGSSDTTDGPNEDVDTVVLPLKSEESRWTS
jgi:hypothetical protein